LEEGTMFEECNFKEIPEEHRGLIIPYLSVETPILCLYEFKGSIHRKAYLITKSRIISCPIKMRKKEIDEYSIRVLEFSNCIGIKEEVGESYIEFVLITKDATSISIIKIYKGPGIIQSEKHLIERIRQALIHAINSSRESSNKHALVPK
jgi:hypothetical protein